MTPLIKSIEINDNTQQSTVPYTVLPDLYVVLGFQYSGSLLLINNNQNIQLSRCGFSGLQTRPKKYQCTSADTKTLLIKFYPWAIPCLMRESSQTLTNNAVSFGDILSVFEQERFEELLFTAPTPCELSTRLEEFFNHLRIGNIDKKVDNHFIGLIKQTMNNSCYQVKQLEEISGYTTRTIERRFKELVGFSPKKFLLLKRFQLTLKYLQAGLSWEDIMEKCAYYDQSHLINSFKEFSGAPPSLAI
ncbi:transcriptional activator FtrA [Legionella lansingensis]|uniref:Transcriptional activator FtrA n=1 Tax=Legionella lansingensis TaxID=45067 RepID=A0A0W0VS66_9GAMM|nr:helix-turn-helix domain-containing protein [Legionella lansingensis]KTD22649.1 transcriptional activator FtrA [Legionella lansingensis]SNV56090.1 transcriptional activator FtrA [Legionella lansingensis]